MTPARDFSSPSGTGWREQVKELYARLEQELGARDEWCRMRGVCCDFHAADHRLYATGVEVRYLVGARAVPASDGVLCPFWRDGICEARDHRPLGCRTYFCHPDGERRGQELYASYHRALGELGDAAGIPYSYLPWVTQLAALSDREGEPRGGHLDRDSGDS